MGTWYFYDLESGALSGRRLTGPEDLLAANTPPGCGAVAVDDGTVLAAHNRRVNVKTGEIEAHQPPAPADDEWRTWQWDDAAERWVPVPTLAARKLEARAPLLQDLAAEDARAIRPLAELVQAIVAGERMPDDAKAVLAEIHERKAGLRDALSTIDQAESEPDLNVAASAAALSTQALAAKR